jgi:medium-chain acyl-[acyl-carrier-protein] hydrolase
LGDAMTEFDRWIVRHRPNSMASLRLFCFPIAGGNASTFQTWAENLPDDIEVCAVQFPGRQQRASEMPYRRMPLAVQALEKAIRPYLDVPFAIFGTCTGTLVGYELAQRLRRTASVEPIHFFSSCCRAPHMPDRDKPIHGLRDDELWLELDRLGGTPPMVTTHPEMKSMLLPILRADFELAETYHYREVPPLGCPITVFGGLEDEIVSRDEIESWRKHTTGAFQIRMLNGGHYLLEKAEGDLLNLIGSACANGNLAYD